MVPAVVTALAQVSAVMLAVVVPAALTVNERLQLCPPNERANNAVPDEAGVPEMVYDKLPAPLANVPDESVAVNPVTPVDEIALPAT